MKPQQVFHSFSLQNYVALTGVSAIIAMVATWFSPLTLVWLWAPCVGIVMVALTIAGAKLADLLE